MPKLILFGAGASYGAEQVQPYCPPLGQGLFDDLQGRYPQAWGQIPAEQKNLFVPNFEPGMGALWSSGWHGTAVLMRCLADYFAQFRPLPGNAYSRLLEQLDRNNAFSKTHFSTLNYDCLLEYAGREMSRKICYDSPDSSDSNILSILKIHGSCNFLPDSKSIKGLAQFMGYSASNVSWDVPPVYVDASRVRPFVTEYAFYPAMAAYMEGKPVHSCQNAIKQLQEWWKNAVERAETIGIIGVKPNVSDVHIWQPLASTDAELIVIGDNKAYTDWIGEHRSSKKTRIVGSRFADSLDKFVKAFIKPR